MLSELTRISQEQRNAKIALELQHLRELEEQEEQYNIRIRSAIGQARNAGADMTEIAKALGYKTRQSVYVKYGRAAKLQEPVTIAQVEPEGITINGDVADVDGVTFKFTDGAWVPPVFDAENMKRLTRLVEYVAKS